MHTLARRRTRRRAAPAPAASTGRTTTGSSRSSRRSGVTICCAYAAELGLDRDAFAQCLDQRRFAADVEARRRRRSRRSASTARRRFSSTAGPSSAPFRRRVPVHRGGRIEGTALMAFVRVAAVEEIAVGQGTLVEHGGLTIALFNAGGGRFVACSPTCPHEDGPLGRGLARRQRGRLPVARVRLRPRQRRLPRRAGPRRVRLSGSRERERRRGRSALTGVRRRRGARQPRSCDRLRNHAKVVTVGGPRRITSP